MKNNKKGFTLAELLIVVAIIAVLVAVSIPIFSSQLEKAREATDAANLRAAYAEVMANAITDGTALTKNVEQRQLKAAWQNTTISFPTGFTIPSPVDQASAANKGWAVASDADGVITVTALASAPGGGWDY